MFINNVRTWWESIYISDLRSSAIYYGPSIDGCSITAKKVRSMEKVCKREVFGMICRLGLCHINLYLHKVINLMKFLFSIYQFHGLGDSIDLLDLEYVNSCPPSKDSTKEMNHGQDGSLFADSSFVFIFSKGSDGGEVTEFKSLG